MPENKLLGFALTVAVLAVIGMFLLQIVSLVISKFFGGTAIQLGSTFLLLLVIVITVVVVSLAIYWGFKFEKFQVFLILAIIGVMLYLVFKARTLIPEIFSTTTGAIPGTSLSWGTIGIVLAVVVFLIFAMKKK